MYLMVALDRGVVSVLVSVYMVLVLVSVDMYLMCVTLENNN